MTKMWSSFRLHLFDFDKFPLSNVQNFTLTHLPSPKFEKYSPEHFLYSPASIYLLKVNNRNTRTRCEICSKLTIETLEQGVKYVQS